MQSLSCDTLHDLFQHSIRAFGERPALTSPTQRLTFKDVGKKVALLQEVFKKHHIQAGDKVAIISENMPHWGVAYFAITTMGAVVVPVLADFHENEKRHILRSSDAKALFISEKQSDLLMDESFDNLGLIITMDSLEVMSKENSDTAVHSLLDKAKDRLKHFKQEKSSVQELTEDSIAALIFTSGTSGHSKGVLLSHKNIVSNAAAIEHVQKITDEDSFVSVLPLAHTYECTVGFIMPFRNGASIYYMDKTPTPTLLKRTLAQVRPTCMLSVPLIIEKIYKNNIQPKFQEKKAVRFAYNTLPFARKKLNKIAGKKLLETFGGRLKFFGIGGAPLARHVEAFLQEAGFPYIIGYGLTETSPLLAASPQRHQKLGSTGPSLHGVELKLVNVNEATQEGEVIARGANIMQGYYKNPDATAEVLKDGWFYTGDLGRFDEEGYLYIMGRSKNVIIGPNGENIYPEQIESLIGEREEVADALVYEDEGRLIARVHLDYEKFDMAHKDEDLSEKESHQKIEALLEEMRQELNGKVSGFSRISRFIEQREAFEMTPTKKIKRYLYN